MLIRLLLSRRPSTQEHEWQRVSVDVPYHNEGGGFDVVLRRSSGKDDTTTLTWGGAPSGRQEEAQAVPKLCLTENDKTTPNVAERNT